MTFFQPDRKLQEIGDRLIHTTCNKFAINRDRIAITLLVYERESIVNTATDPTSFWSHKPRGWDFRGTELTYPASVVKLFYMVALHEWLDKGMLAPSPEIERALRDAIVDSSNDATGFIVDVLTGTTSGPELSDGPLQTWKSQRQIVNRYFHNLGVPEYSFINACQKTWCDGPYGRERAFYGENMENRNMLTTNATAHLLYSIVAGIAITNDRSAQMRQLLQRSLKPEDLDKDPENQVTGFLGGSLPQAAKLWSKAGLTSQVRHDAAYIEVFSKPAFTLVVFTEGHADNSEILPFISSSLIADLS